MSCAPETGRLLAALAAGVPTGGHVLELGTGMAVGAAWITSGLRSTTDIELLTVEIDPGLAAQAAALPWPTWVNFVVGDAVEVTSRTGSFDLIFADTPGASGTGWTPRWQP